MAATAIVSPFDAAVVGSGPNGLCAAIALARAGWRVVVYEGAPTVGGGARSAELTLPGFVHDVCSAVHPMAVGSAFLTELPLEAHGLRWIHPPAPLAHPLDGGAVLLERDLQATARGLGADGAAWASLFGPFVGRWPELARDAMGPPGLPRSPLLMARFGLLAARSASGLARARFSTRQARALFGGVAAHSVLPLDGPASAPIGLMLTVAAHAVGWPFPRGGAQALSDALLAHLRALGGELVLNHPVRSLDDIATDGPVLFETAPSRLADIAGDALPRGFRDRLLRYKHGPGAFKVDWALDGPIPWADAACARAATVHLGGPLDLMERSERACWQGEVSDAPFVLLTQPSLFDPTRAPEGKHTAWAYIHVPPGSDTDHTELVERMVEQAAPGFGDRILARHTRTAAAYERYNPNYVGGDTLVGAATWDQLLTRPVARLSPYTTPNRRIFLCSAATPPGGGVHGLCGAHAAAQVLARFREPGR